MGTRVSSSSFFSFYVFSIIFFQSDNSEIAAKIFHISSGCLAQGNLKKTLGLSFPEGLALAYWSPTVTHSQTRNPVGTDALKIPVCIGSDSLWVGKMSMLLTIHKPRSCLGKLTGVPSEGYRPHIHKHTHINFNMFLGVYSYKIYFP